MVGNAPEGSINAAKMTPYRVEDRARSGWPSACGASRHRASARGGRGSARLSGGRRRARSPARTRPGGHGRRGGGRRGRAGPAPGWGGAPPRALSPPRPCSSTASRSTWRRRAARPTLVPAPSPRFAPRRSPPTSPAATSPSTRWRCRSAGDPELIDPHGGSRTCERGELRVLHAGSFVDDPTRALRAARYAARYGFTLEPADRRAAARRTDLSTVSRGASRRRAAKARRGARGTAGASSCSAEWGLLDLEPDAVELARGGRRAGSPRSRGRRSSLARDAVLAAALGRGVGEARQLASAKPARPSEAVELAPAAEAGSSWRSPGRWGPSGSTATSRSGEGSGSRSMATT